MTINGLLPIGSVVLLKNSTKRLMIIGVAQVSQSEDGRKLYDYTGVLYPEGYMSAEKNYLFNLDQIDKLYAIGYQDDEALAFKEKADALMEKARAEEQKNPSEQN